MDASLKLRLLVYLHVVAVAWAPYTKETPCDEEYWPCHMYEEESGICDMYRGQTTCPIYCRLSGGKCEEYKRKDIECRDRLEVQPKCGDSTVDCTDIVNRDACPVSCQNPLCKKVWQDKNPAPPKAPSVCSAGWRPLYGKCYKPVTTCKDCSPASAQSECRKLSGNLVRIDSLRQEKLLHKTLTNLPNVYYIDGKYNPDDALWYDSDGKIMNNGYTNFSPDPAEVLWRVTLLSAGGLNDHTQNTVKVTVKLESGVTWTELATNGVYRVRTFHHWTRRSEGKLSSFDVGLDATHDRSDTWKGSVFVEGWGRKLTCEPQIIDVSGSADVSGCKTSVQGKMIWRVEIWTPPSVTLSADATFENLRVRLILQKGSVWGETDVPSLETRGFILLSDKSLGKLEKFVVSKVGMDGWKGWISVEGEHELGTDEKPQQMQCRNMGIDSKGVHPYDRAHKECDTSHTGPVKHEFTVMKNDAKHAKSCINICMRYPGDGYCILHPFKNHDIGTRAFMGPFHTSVAYVTLHYHQCEDLDKPVFQYRAKRRWTGIIVVSTTLQTFFCNVEGDSGPKLEETKTLHCKRYTSPVEGSMCIEAKGQEWKPRLCELKQKNENYLCERDRFVCEKKTYDPTKQSCCLSGTISDNSGGQCFDCGAGNIEYDDRTHRCCDDIGLVILTPERCPGTEYRFLVTHPGHSATKDYTVYATLYSNNLGRASTSEVQYVKYSREGNPIDVYYFNLKGNQLINRTNLAVRFGIIGKGQWKISQILVGIRSASGWPTYQECDTDMLIDERSYINCPMYKDPCDVSPPYCTQNTNGECTVRTDRRGNLYPICSCKSGFTGQRCEKKIGVPTWIVSITTADHKRLTETATKLTGHVHFTNHYETPTIEDFDMKLQGCGSGQSMTSFLSAAPDVVPKYIDMQLQWCNDLMAKVTPRPYVKWNIKSLTVTNFYNRDDVYTCSLNAWLGVGVTAGCTLDFRPKLIPNLTSPKRRILLNFERNLTTKYDWMRTSAHGTGFTVNSHGAIRVCQTPDATIPTDNWLRLPYMDRGRARYVHLTVKYVPLQQCSAANAPRHGCTNHFRVYYLESDGPFAHRMEDLNQFTYRQIKYANAKSNKKTTLNKAHDTFEYMHEINKQGVYFAFRDQGGCVDINSILVYTEMCDVIKNSLITPALDKNPPIWPNKAYCEANDAVKMVRLKMSIYWTSYDRDWAHVQSRRKLLVNVIMENGCSGWTLISNPEEKCGGKGSCLRRYTDLIYKFQTVDKGRLIGLNVKHDYTDGYHSFPHGGHDSGYLLLGDLDDYNNNLEQCKFVNGQMTMYAEGIQCSSGEYTVNSPPTQKQECPPGWGLHRGTCYGVIKCAETVCMAKSAVTHCEAVGAKPAIVKSEEINTLIKEEGDKQSLDYVWLGMRNTGNKPWKDVTLVYDKWSKRDGQPNGDARHACVQMYIEYTSDYKGEWNDVPCDSIYKDKPAGYACSMPATGPRCGRGWYSLGGRCLYPVLSPRTCQDDELQWPGSHLCRNKVSAMTQTQGIEQCKAIGGRLMRVDDGDTNTDVTTLGMASNVYQVFVDGNATGADFDDSLGKRLAYFNWMSGCPSGWRLHGGTCYGIVQCTGTFCKAENAVGLCETEGAKPAIVKSEEINTLIKEEGDKQNLDYVWLGMRNTANKPWKDVTLVYDNWSKRDGQPDGDILHACALMYINYYSQFKGEWNDAPCDFVYKDQPGGYACSMPDASTLECPYLWRPVWSGSTCYGVVKCADKAHCLGKDAVEMCKRHGAEPVVVTNPRINDVINLQAARMNLDVVWIEREKKNTPNQRVYTKWATNNQPDGDKHADCIQLHIKDMSDYAGEWNDVRCDMFSLSSGGFACKKPVTKASKHEQCIAVHVDSTGVYNGQWKRRSCNATHQDLTAVFMCEAERNVDMKDVWDTCARTKYFPLANNVPDKTPADEAKRILTSKFLADVERSIDMIAVDLQQAFLAYCKNLPMHYVGPLGCIHYGLQVEGFGPRDFPSLTLKTDGANRCCLRDEFQELCPFNREIFAIAKVLKVYTTYLTEAAMQEKTELCQHAKKARIACQYRQLWSCVLVTKTDRHYFLCTMERAVRRLRLVLGEMRGKLDCVCPYTAPTTAPDYNYGQRIDTTLATLTVTDRVLSNVRVMLILRRAEMDTGTLYTGRNNEVATPPYDSHQLMQHLNVLRDV